MGKLNIPELKAKRAAATSGKWHVEQELDESMPELEDTVEIWRGVFGPDNQSLNKGEDYELFGEADAACIVAEHNAMGELIELLEQATALLKEAHGFPCPICQRTEGCTWHDRRAVAVAKLRAAGLLADQAAGGESDG